MDRRNHGGMTYVLCESIKCCANSRATDSSEMALEKQKPDRRIHDFPALPSPSHNETSVEEQ
jgi:hypothetical protein